MLIAIIADTHLPRGSRRLPSGCVERLRSAELVLHAGDVCTAGALAQMIALGSPLVAVHGNVDEPALAKRLPAELELEVSGGLRLAMTHDAGPARGRLPRMRKRFPRADAVVFGHSHIPLLEADDEGFQIFNPGSPTDRRRQAHHTMGLARVDEGKLAFEHVQLEPG